jgi:hypothetical protein
MGTPATARAKAKGNQVPSAAVPPIVISVTNGQPDKNSATVTIGGTIRFDNNDNIDYLVRLTDQKKHAAVDVLLPSVGSVTFMTDPDAKAKDEVDFDLLQAITPNSSKGTIVASGGGGKIIIGPSAPTPPPPPKRSR